LTSFRFIAQEERPSSRISQIILRRIVFVTPLCEGISQKQHFHATSFCEITLASLCKLGFNVRLSIMHEANFQG